MKTKKEKLIFSIMLGLAMPLFFACTNVSDSDDGYTILISGDMPKSFTGKVEWNYSESNDIFKVEDSVKTVTINGNLGNKQLYYALVNKSKLFNIGRSYVKIPSTFHEKSDSRMSANFSTQYSTKVTPLALNDGSTEKSLYLLTSKSGDDEFYENKKVKLWAHNDICNVWVVNDDKFFNTTISKKEISQKFAAKFAEMYPMIRNVFGVESDNIYREKEVPMDTVSDTGTKVNIVIYDIMSDGEVKEKDSEILGFFHPKDYIKSNIPFIEISKYSNEGKYFYIDSFRAKEDENEIYSTLAHEFQHMIHFNMKELSDTNFNEMCSMLCEDMMQSYLGIKDSQSPKNRFTTFATNYFSIGIRNYPYDSDENPLPAYANAYAFGSWLCRQYGGAALVKEMMHNGKENNNCIVAAVNKLNRTNFTFDDLFGQFIKAVLGFDEKYTFKQNAKETITYSNNGKSYTYPMKAIDISECSDFPITVFDDFYLPNLPSNYGLYLIKINGSFSPETKSCTFDFFSLSGKTQSGMTGYLYIK